MPFALVNASATFQTMMNEILQEFLDQGVVVYINDILTYSQTLEQYIILVRKVLQRLGNTERLSPWRKACFM